MYVATKRDEFFSLSKQKLLLACLQEVITLRKDTIVAKVLIIQDQVLLSSLYLFFTYYSIV